MIFADVIKDCAMRRLSWIICVGSKCHHSIFMRERKKEITHPRAHSRMRKMRQHRSWKGQGTNYSPELLEGAVPDLIHLALGLSGPQNSETMHFYCFRSSVGRSVTEATGKNTTALCYPGCMLSHGFARY